MTSLFAEARMGRALDAEKCLPLVDEMGEAYPELAREKLQMRTATPAVTSVSSRTPSVQSRWSNISPAEVRLPSTWGALFCCTMVTVPRRVS